VGYQHQHHWQSKMTFAIVGGADVSKFTLKGNELTFKATDFDYPPLAPSGSSYKKVY
jgi:hypothetical protein